MIIVLRDGIKRSEGNAPTMRLNKSHQPSSNTFFESRRAQCQQRVNQPNGSFLSAHPVGPGVRRIGPPPVLHPVLHRMEIPCVSAYSPGAGKNQRPTKPRYLPHDFDISHFGVEVCNLTPMHSGLRVSLILEWVQEPIRRVSDVMGVHRKVVRPSFE